jgi:hypothetical protein
VAEEKKIAIFHMEVSIWKQIEKNIYFFLKAKTHFVVNINMGSFFKKD